MYYYYSELREKYQDKIMDLYFNKRISPKVLSKKFPVSESTISRWIRIFAAENNLKLHRMRKSTKPVRIPITTEADSNDINQLREENRRLQKQLKEEHLRAELYAKMIEITEKDLHISISKKAGTKR